MGGSCGMCVCGVWVWDKRNAVLHITGNGHAGHSHYTGYKNRKVRKDSKGSKITTDSNDGFTGHSGREDYYCLLWFRLREPFFYQFLLHKEGNCTSKLV